MNMIFATKKISQKRTLGKTLSLTRKKKGISIEKAETDTKIRYKFINALEDADYKNMPPDVYNMGFLERYCEYLGLDKEKCLIQYKDEKELYEQMHKKYFYFSDKKKLINPGNPEKFTQKLKFVVTPQIFITSFIVILVIGILGYIWFQVKSFAAAPPLEVDNPAEQIIVSMNSIEIKGKTDPTVTLNINGRAIGINEDGSFVQTIELNEGINNIEIKANNKANKVTIKNIKVLVVSKDDMEGQKGNNEKN